MHMWRDKIFSPNEAIKCTSLADFIDDSIVCSAYRAVRKLGHNAK